MRKVNEPRLSAIPTTKRASRHYRAVVGKRDIPVSCKRCGYTTDFDANAMRNMNGKDWICRECAAEDKREVNRAIIALAKRKGKIK